MQVMTTESLLALESIASGEVGFSPSHFFQLLLVLGLDGGVSSGVGDWNPPIPGASQVRVLYDESLVVDIRIASVLLHA